MNPAGGGRGFPPALTSFVGRSEDIDKLVRLLSSHRLVTLIGPGGVGKTRLAAEASRAVSDRFADRVWLVELASVTAGEQVPAVIATVLGAHQHSGRSPVPAVADLLRGAPALLILDNCEQVVEAVAEFSADLLPRCDDLVILATSREHLGVSGEARLRIRPLGATRGDAGSGRADGITLFVDRARLADPSFDLEPAASALVEEIVVRLDGLPLAIELAAARVATFGLAELHRHLVEPLRVLTEGARAAPARHSSLVATVDWSYQLLGDPLRRVFRRLAVLPGPFTLRAAEAVGGDDAEALVWQLVDRSLLSPPRVGPDGRTRYLMLETVRAFAADLLGASEERRAAETALIDYAAQVAEVAATGMRTSGGEAAAAARLDADGALFREALSLASRYDPAAALHLAVSLAPWWQLRGRSGYGYPLLERALGRYPARDEVWLAAHTWLGRLAHSTGASREALTHFDAVCASAAEEGPSPQLVDGLAGRSASLRNLGRLGEAGSAARDALRIARDVDYPEGEATAVTQLCLVANYADDPETATDWAREAGRLDATRLPDRVARRVRVILTVALADSDEPAAARETCAAGLESARAAGDVVMQADFLSFATRIALRLGQTEEARAHLAEALQLTARDGYSLRVLDCLDDAARLCGLTGRPAEAITLWAARAAGAGALGAPDLVKDIRYREEPMVAAVRRLGPDATRAAERRGARLNLQTAAEFAAMLAGSGHHEQAESAQSTESLESTASPESPAGAGLTPRERELLALVAHGRTDAQIAGELFISIRTVRSHLDRIRDKTGNRRRADLTMLALRAGLV